MTPHNEASRGDYAETVLVPGDPLRAQWIAETFLDNPICVNRVRGAVRLYRLLSGKADQPAGDRHGPAVIFHLYP